MKFAILTSLLILMAAAAFGGIGYDSDGMLLIEGQRTFIIGSYHLPKSDSPYRELHDNGFNLLRTGASIGELDSCLQNELKAWVTIGAIDAQNPAKSKAAILERVNNVKGHPALLMWETVDEPAWTWLKAEPRVKPELIIQTYQSVKAVDPDHLFYLNHAPVNLVSTLRAYNPGTDVVACDIYPVIPHGIKPMYALFPDGKQGDLSNCTISQVGEYADKMRRVAGPDKPVFMVLQGFAWELLRKKEEQDPSKILFPDFRQTRFMAWNAIIHGANGLIYWGTHYTPQPSQFWSDLKKVTRELADLQPVLSAPAVDMSIAKYYHETGHSIDAGVEIVAKRLEGTLYLLTANADKNPVKISLSGFGKKKRCEVINEGRTLKIFDDRITDFFEPFDVHIYKLTD